MNQIEITEIYESYRINKHRNNRNIGIMRERFCSNAIIHWNPISEMIMLQNQNENIYIRCPHFMGAQLSAPLNLSIR